MKSIKTLSILLSPILLFAVLLVPYNFVNQHLIVDWLGCGCPVIDEAGNIYVVSKEKELNAALKETFKQIEENLQNNLTQSFSPKLTLSKLPKLEVKKK